LHSIVDSFGSILFLSTRLWDSEICFTFWVNRFPASGRMKIRFSSEKLAKICNRHELLVRKYGPERAKRIRRRLDDLEASPLLDDLRHLPGRCHELTGDLEGLLSLDLDGPYRLYFRPAHNPPPSKADGGLDWSKVTDVIIEKVCDPHE
jgi:plasmid maintenance system killer protein